MVKRNPGKKDIQKACCKNVLPKARIFPQLGFSGGIPNPRKLKDASVNIANAKTYVACTKTGAIVLGAKCTNNILQVGVPKALAASIYICSRSVNTVALTILTILGVSTNVITPITFHILEPNIATRAKANNKVGNDIIASITLCIIISSLGV